jgi:hypothetical protein
MKSAAHDRVSDDGRPVHGRRSSLAHLRWMSNLTRPALRLFGTRPGSSAPSTLSPRPSRRARGTVNVRQPVALDLLAGDPRVAPAWVPHLHCPRTRSPCRCSLIWILKTRRRGVELAGCIRLRWSAASLVRESVSTTTLFRWLSPRYWCQRPYWSIDRHVVRDLPKWRSAI